MLTCKRLVSLSTLLALLYVAKARGYSVPGWLGKKAHTLHLTTSGAGCPLFPIPKWCLPVPICPICYAWEMRSMQQWAQAGDTPLLPRLYPVGGSLELVKEEYRRNNTKYPRCPKTSEVRVSVILSHHTPLVFTSPYKTWRFHPQGLPSSHDTFKQTPKITPL